MIRASRESHTTVFVPGDVLKGGRYKIFDQLGAGGMGEVWRAFDAEARTYDEQWVAVKVCAAKLALDKDSKRRLEKEGRTLLEARHPNLVRVLHADIDDQRNAFFYVMEYLEGEPLTSLLEHRGPLDLEEALWILAEICDGAHGLHVLGIVHRDLKPDNIFIGKPSPGDKAAAADPFLATIGRVVILDLGVAKFDPRRFPDRATQPTGPNTVIGTLAWMSPEQILGSSQLDGRSDVYAIGLIAYRMLAGFHPAQQGPGGWMPSDLSQWGGWHVNSRPKPLPLVMPWMHLRVWKVIERALAKDPKERHGSAQALADELRGLRSWLGEHQLLRPPVSTPRPSPRQAIEEATTEQERLPAEAPGAPPVTTRSGPGARRAGDVEPGSPPSGVRGAEEPRGAESDKTAPASPAVGPSGVPSWLPLPSPRTAAGTEILHGPSPVSEGAPPPRTASGTEIIRLPAGMRAPFSMAAPASPPSRTAGAAGARPSGGTERMPREREEHEDAAARAEAVDRGDGSVEPPPATEPLPRRSSVPPPEKRPWLGRGMQRSSSTGSQRMPFAQSVPIRGGKAAREERRARRALAAMLGVALLVAAMLLVLVRVLRRDGASSSEPSAATTASASAEAPVTTAAGATSSSASASGASASSGAASSEPRAAPETPRVIPPSAAGGTSAHASVSVAVSASPAPAVPLKPSAPGAGSSAGWKPPSAKPAAPRAPAGPRPFGDRLED
jgi:eukaryotic-like serine/threonine-protein kinase